MKKQQESWEKEFEEAFNDMVPLGMDEALSLLKNCVRSLLSKQKEELLREVERIKGPAPLGTWKRAVMRVETVKKADIGMAHIDGYKQAVDDVIKLLRTKLK